MRNFHVYIIESPSPVDLYHRRFEGDALQKTLQLSEINSSYRLTVSFEAFKASFYVGLSEHFKSNGVAPLIHISAHGDDNGIVLTSGELITWDQLKNLLLPLNKVLKGGLLLSLSSCSGSSGCKMAMKDDDFPFFAVIGSNGSPTWSETNIAFATFYHLFHIEKPIYDCVEAMKISSGNKNFVMVSSKIARQAYLEVIKKQSALATLEKNIPSGQPSNLTKALTK